MIVRWFSIPIIALSPFVTCACSGKCDEGLLTPAGMTIAVVDAGSGERLCNANVRVHSAEGIYLLDRMPDCRCSGAGAGTYSLEVSADGYVTKTIDGVNVAADECNNARTVFLTIQLEKQ